MGKGDAMTMSITIPDFGSSAATQVGAPAPSKVNVKKVVILLLLAVLVAVPVTMYWTNVCFMTQAMILETFGSEEQLTQLIYDYGWKLAKESGIQTPTKE